MASEKGRLYLRRRTWWIQVYDHRGQRLRFSTGTRDEKEARRMLRQKIRELDDGHPVSVPTNLTMKHMLDALEEEYQFKGRRSLPRLQWARKTLEAYFGQTRKVVSVRGQDLRRYLLHRVNEEGAAKATVKYELAILRRAFVVAQRDEVLDRVPVFPEFEGLPSREVYVPDGDHRAMLTHLDDPVSHLATFLYWTGWRVGETGDEGALNLRWEDVDWATGTLLVGDGSLTKKPGGRFPFTEVPEVEQLLRTLHGRHPKWVFARPNGRRLGYRGALRAFKRAQEAAGVGPYVFHDYRRSVARRLEQGGVPRTTAKRITGHRTDQIFEKYAITEDEDMRRAIRSLGSPAGPHLGTHEE